MSDYAIRKAREAIDHALNSGGARVGPDTVTLPVDIVARLCILADIAAEGDPFGGRREARAYIPAEAALDAVWRLGQYGPSEDEVCADGHNYGDWEAGFMCAYNIALARLRAAITAQQENNDE